MKRVKKLWGSECWIVNRNDYCGKLLYVNPLYQCSLHYHPLKNETFYVLKGTIAVQLGEDRLVLGQGESVDVPSGTPHRFWCYGDVPATLVEFSTHHDDADVVRLEPSQKIPSEQMEQMALFD